jgi:hypothetical protein
MVDFIDANAPRVGLFSVWLDDDETRMTVIHVHPDTASLEHPMKVGAPVFRGFAELLSLRSIEVFGEPSERALALLEERPARSGLPSSTCTPSRAASCAASWPGRPPDVALSDVSRRRSRPRQ